ncbi:MAG: hypothetical protein HY913_09015 [Desulfomonile tiedjei]|nr:hypothetical protein [Desulfomonile tiedjei]
MNSTSRPGEDEFETLITMLRSEGHDQVAQRLHMLLHEIAWTTGSELTGELGLEIVKFQRSAPKVSPALQELLAYCMNRVKQVWPNIEKVRAF